MICAAPRRLLPLQEMKQLLAANFIAGSFGQKSAAPAGTDKRVNVAKQVFGQEDVGALGHCVYR